MSVVVGLTKHGVQVFQSLHYSNSHFLTVCSLSEKVVEFIKVQDLRLFERLFFPSKGIRQFIYSTRI